MVALGRANSRVKDCDDVWMLTSTFDLNPDRMRHAIAVTSACRHTAIPNQVPDGLSDAIADDLAKQWQWHAFVQKQSGQAPGLTQVLIGLRRRLMSVLLPGQASPGLRCPADGRKTFPWRADFSPRT